MNAPENFYTGNVKVEDSWAASVTQDLRKSRRNAWIVAGVAAAIALLLAIALAAMLPLKETEPYVLAVDRQTGNVETLNPLDEATISADMALTRSLLAQYVTARESFDADSIQRDFRRVSLWSAPEAQQRYANLMAASNPASPLAYMPRSGTISVEIRSISSLNAASSLVRFTTIQTDRSGRALPPQYWAAVVNYQFTGATMSEADRLDNPLGFQVTRYRRDAETLPEVSVEDILDQSLLPAAAAQ
ncbi:MAG: VirB8/TrbF family protein [Hyphomonas sp.]|uniref:virB8 family protein n=1 Tax=Hyphomonas sp. TaxID=87 RepID=UPI0032971299